MDTRPLLLQLRLRGRIADPTTPESETLTAAGHATVKGGRLVLSPAGRAAADVEFAIAGDDRAGVATAYEQFGPRNAELIRICHDWQVRDGGHANDHRDHAYDWSVIDRLAGVDERTGPVIRRLGRRIAAFGDYRDRLRAARTRVEAGEHDWFTSPRIDSYHTVWMELHEHLLVALGLDRAAETAENDR